MIPVIFFRIVLPIFVRIGHCILLPDRGWLLLLGHFACLGGRIINIIILVL
jgi:hypothetical protein